MFFHRLEQRALRLGAGAVDLVGQQHLREDRAGVEDEGLLAALVDADADQVGGHQVGGELGAREPQAQRHRERLRERGLADAGDVLDEQVAAGEQAGDAIADVRAFADDDRANLVDQSGQAGGEVGLQHVAVTLVTVLHATAARRQKKERKPLGMENVMTPTIPETSH